MKKPSVKSLFIVGGFVALVVLGCWWKTKPQTIPLGSAQELALKAAQGDTNALKTLRAQGAEALPSLVILLRRHDPFLQRLAHKLGPSLPKRFGQPLIKRAGPLNAAGFRAAAAVALGSLGPGAKEAVPALLERLHDSESYVATSAATALSRIGEASVPGLILALSDPDPTVRHSAVYALGEAGPAAEPAIPELIQKLQDPDTTIRASTSYSLQIIGYPTIVALSNVIDHADAKAREAAVTEYLHFYRALQVMTRPLVKMANANDVSSRCRAIEALGTIRAADAASIHAVAVALQDPVVDVRLAALKTLAMMPWRAQEFTGTLAKCLRDPSEAVRIAASKLLGDLGPAARPALNDLRRCCQENSGPVRAAAQHAIEKIEQVRPHEDQ